MRVDELLRETGDAWQAPAAPSIDLDAALVRRARRLRSTAAGWTAAVVLVGSGAVWAAWPGPGIPAIPADSPTPTPSVAPSENLATAEEEPVRRIEETLQAEAMTNPELREQAAQDALLFARGSTPVTAEAVRTTYRAAEDLLSPETSSAGGGEQQVWLLQLHGQFVCGACSRPFGADPPAGRVIQRVLDAGTWEGLSFSIGREPADLSQLGEVVRLPLGPEVQLRPFDDPDPVTTALSDAVRHALVGIEHDDPVMANAAQTTLGEAQQVLFGHTPYPPSGSGVWFVELQGSFSCSECSSLGDAPHRSASVLTLVIDRTTGEPHLKVLSDKTVGFAELGGAQDVVHLDPRQLSAAPDWQPEFASYPRTTPLGMGGGAALNGRLLLLGGCLVVESDSGPVQVPVLPSPAATWSPLERTLTIGRDVLRIGDRVRWGGGYSTTPGAGYDVPGSCTGLGEEHFRVDSA